MMQGCRYGDGKDFCWTNRLSQACGWANSNSGEHSTVFPALFPFIWPEGISIVADDSALPIQACSSFAAEQTIQRTVEFLRT